MQGAHHKRNRGVPPRRAGDPAVLRCIDETRRIAVVHGAPGGGRMPREGRPGGRAAGRPGGRPGAASAP
ncbi:hypothetical protein, partial [Burkholderia cenocepacia]|nr:hypothetical protein [Burkholderia cenocepacia]